MNDFAFIVPYRNRIGHLTAFVPHMTRRFRRAKIYLIEQGDEKEFNRGALLNIGYVMYGHQHPYCAYHDIDMLPSRADYSFPQCPTHLATKVSQFKYEMPFADYFGGVVLFNKEDYEKCGGYSNHFWGWGGEDNEICNHLTSIGMRIERRVGYYQSLYHERAFKGAFDKKKLEQSKLPRSDFDGINNVTYQVVKEIPNFFGCTKLTVLL